MLLSKVQLYLALTIASCFILQKVYVPLFLCAPFFVKMRVNKSASPIIIAFAMALFWNLVVFLLNLRDASSLQMFKVVTVFVFVASVVGYISSGTKEGKETVGKLFYPLVIILALNSLHVFINVHKAGLWSMPFDGSMTSSAAYKIQNSGIYFGALNKNIWATKFLFIFLCYCNYFVLGLRKFDKIHVLLIAIFALTVIYGMSRTSILGLLVYLTVLAAYKISFTRFRVVFYLTVLPIVSVFAFNIISGFVHFTFDETDGFYSRVLLWRSIAEIDPLKFLAGSGQQYGAIHIPLYTGLDNDNFHNVYLNQLVDTGVVGLFFYVFLYAAFLRAFIVEVGIKLAVTLFIPLFVVVNSHYTGYDNDIFVYLVMTLGVLNASVERNESSLH